MYVVHPLRFALLGLSAIEAQRIIKFLDGVTVTRQSFEALFPGLFSGLGSMAGECKIRLKPGAVPSALSAARSVPIPLREGVRAQLKKMKNDGVIRRVDGPTEWCAGIVPV